MLSELKFLYTADRHPEKFFTSKWDAGRIALDTESNLNVYILRGTLPEPKEMFFHRSYTYYENVADVTLILKSDLAKDKAVLSRDLDQTGYVKFKGIPTHNSFKIDIAPILIQNLSTRYEQWSLYDNETSGTIKILPMASFEFKTILCENLCIRLICGKRVKSGYYDYYIANGNKEFYSPNAADIISAVLTVLLPYLTLRNIKSLISTTQLLRRRFYELKPLLANILGGKIRHLPLTSAVKGWTCALGLEESIIWTKDTKWYIQIRPYMFHICRENLQFVCITKIDSVVRNIDEANNSLGFLIDKIETDKPKHLSVQDLFWYFLDNLISNGIEYKRS